MTHAWSWSWSGPWIRFKKGLAGTAEQHTILGKGQALVAIKPELQQTMKLLRRFPMQKVGQYPGT